MRMVRVALFCLAFAVPLAAIATFNEMTCPSFCTTGSERVYITA